MADLRKRGIVTKVRKLRTGERVGGIAFTQGSLAQLLRNRFYIGEVVFKGEVLKGEQPLSLPKTIFERIDGVGRLESDRRQCPRTARSDVYRACPSQAQRGFARHYNSSRISQGFAEGAQH